MCPPSCAASSGATTSTTLRTHAAPRLRASLKKCFTSRSVRLAIGMRTRAWANTETLAVLFGGSCYSGD